MNTGRHHTLSLKLEDVSFSRFGSWLSVSPLIAKFQPYDMDRYYLRCHHHDTKPVIEITPMDGAEKSDLRPQAFPDRMIWGTAAERYVEMVFDGTDTLRLRGKGLGVKLTPYLRTEVYSLETEAGKGRLATFNILPALRKFQIESLRGLMQWQSRREDETGKEFDVELTAVGEDGAEWEIAIDLFTSVREPRDRQAFDAVRSNTAADFNAFLAGTPPCPDTLQDARTLAAYIGWSATVKPFGLLKRPTMLMSKNFMCKVWSWDHCFNAMALAPSKPQLAWDQMLVIADLQDEFGCYPDAYNDTSSVFNYTKPPVHGWTVQELVTRLDSAADDPRLQEMFTSLERWTDFWLTHRRQPSARLAHYMHGYDSGWDNCTMFDETVPIIGPDLNSFLTVQMDCLAELASLLGDSAKSRHWQTQADAHFEAIIDELWDGEKFIAKGAVRGETITSDSLIYCLPILMGQRLPTEIRQKLRDEISRFLTPHGLATEHPESPKFMDDGYWRGPIWGPSTYLIFSGLMRSGETDLAYEIADRFCNMCNEHDFAENHHALTGERLRDRGFTWTASSFLLMAEALHKRDSATALQGQG